MPTLTITPDPASTNSPVRIAGTGFANAKTRVKFDGVILTSWSKGGQSSSSFSITATTRATAGTQTATVEQQSGPTWSVVASATVTVQVTNTDVTAPVISNVATSSVSTTGITIGWSLNEPGTGQIDYGTSTSYGQSTTLDSTLATTFSQTISGLTANTNYFYRIRSADASGNVGTLAGQMFTTLPSAPSGLVATPGDGTVSLSWNP